MSTILQKKSSWTKECVGLPVMILHRKLKKKKKKQTGAMAPQLRAIMALGQDSGFGFQHLQKAHKCLQFQF